MTECADKNSSEIRQVPCDDVISRQAVLDLVDADWKYEGLESPIMNLPPVTPRQFCEDIVRSMVS